MNILITGAAGFVGRSVGDRLVADGENVFCAVRTASQAATLSPGVTVRLVTAIGPDTDYGETLSDIDIIIHLAARVHLIRDSAIQPLDEYRAINVAATINLARQAASAGVRRLVFISSVKVYGEGAKDLLNEESPLLSTDAYGVSKWEAEAALQDLSAETGLEVVVLRPPLVYGPGVKANFLQLIKAVHSGCPLPFARIRNSRSFIYLENLVDAIAICAKHPGAGGHTYLVSDGDDVSTPELIRRIADSFGMSARLFPLPHALMRLAGRVLGKGDAIDRLVCSLSVDSRKIRQDLGWLQPFSMVAGLRKTAEWYENQYVQQR